MPQRRIRLTTLLIVVFALTLANVSFALYQGRQVSQPDHAKGDIQSQGLDEIRNRFPIVDFETPEISDPDKRIKRMRRSARHNNSMLGVRGGMTAPPDSGDTIILNNHWEVQTPRLPVNQSDVVVIGNILDSNAFLSTDQNGVYSEFTFSVEDILKNATTLTVPHKGSIIVERQGGRVRYPSGRIEWYKIALQNMPLPDHRYILFLKQSGEDSFSIITGYELRDSRVYALDSEATQFSIYDGTDEASFLSLVRDTIAK